MRNDEWEIGAAQQISGFAGCRAARVLSRRLTGVVSRVKISYTWAMTEAELLQRIEVNPHIFGGKPIVRGMRIAVEHLLGMLAAGDTPEKILEEYSFLELRIFKRVYSSLLDRPAILRPIFMACDSDNESTSTPLR
jgi:uncharacterized protein (DUF433 family)